MVVRVLPCLLALSACDQGAPAVVAARDDAAPAPVPVDAAVDVAFDAPVDAPPPSYRNLIFLTEDSCLWLEVGPEHERASICTETADNMWRVTRRVMRVIRDGKRTTVLDVRAKLEGFDTGHNALESRIRIATDGMSLVVENIPARSLKARRPYFQLPEPAADCTMAPQRRDYQNDIPGDSGPSFGTERDRQCADTGTYVWRGGRFMRENAH